MAKTPDCSESIYEFHCRPEFDRINKTLEKIDKSLNGNGKPGLNTRVDRVERSAQALVEAQRACIETRQKARESRNSKLWEIARPFIIAAVAAVLTVMGVVRFTEPDISKAEIAQIIKQLSENKE